MDGNTAAALAVATAAVCALALTALMLWRGKWLFLVAGAEGDAVRPEAGENEHAPSRDGRGLLGRRMAVVLSIAAVLVATLLLFECAKLVGAAPLATAATLLNNVAFVGLLVGLAWFFIAQRPSRAKDDAAEQEPRAAARAQTARLDHLPLATIVFTVALIAVVGLVGVLFAGL